MPAYGTNSQGIGMAPGDQAALIAPADTLYQKTPFYGERIAIAPVGHRSGARVRWEGKCSGNPGVIAVAIQEASQDGADFYSNIAGATATAAVLQGDGTYVFSIDEIDAGGGVFRRPAVTAWPNNVTLTLTATVQ